MPPVPMLLDDLLLDAGIHASGATAIRIDKVASDSRSAGPHSLFVAIPGYHIDGHAFAAAAVEQGAVAVVAERPPVPPLPEGVPLLIVPDSRAALAPLAAAIAGHPSRRLTVAGVTGTDGKTTTTTMLWAAWSGAGIAASSLTTVDIRQARRVRPNLTRQTTLEAVELQEHLADSERLGCTHAALEVSSHSLELHRVDAMEARLAVYTRITSEHLDFHGTRERYLAAKARLLDIVARHRGGIAVLDLDDEFAFPVLSRTAVGRRLTYSASGNPAADLIAEDIVADARGVRCRVRTPWGTAPLALQLAGTFNAGNALAAIAAASASGADFPGVISGLEALARVTGRMERVDLGQPFAVVIDYAHTAAALASVLDQLRRATAGRLWVVFGSAGERDREKRPAMGAVAAQAADEIVVTDEDPREENRHAILEEIAHGAEHAGARRGDRLHIIPDRAEAIAHVIATAAPGDCVLLAGKGHEASIIVGRESLPWDERAVAERALRLRVDVAPVPRPVADTAAGTTGV